MEETHQVNQVVQEEGAYLHLSMPSITGRFCCPFPPFHESVIFQLDLFDCHPPPPCSPHHCWEMSQTGQINLP